LKTNSNKIVIAASIVFLLLSLFLSRRLIFLAKQNQEYRIDMAEINNIRYGLLNADEWKYYLAEILTQKINEFQLTPENQEQLQTQIENLLYRLLDEVDKILQNDMGRIKRFVMNAFVDLEKLKENVPELAEALLEEMAKPENKENLNEYVLGKLDSFVAETFNNDEQVKLNLLLGEYERGDRNITSAYLEQLTNQTTNKLRIDALLLIIFLSFIFGINIFFATKNRQSRLLFLLLVAFIFLLNGITIPMIDIEAKISRLTFQLMGENIIFENQVLFFQRKSIIDVVWILISTRKIDMIFVGFLIFTFSVLFPVTKLACSYFTIRFPQKTARLKWVYFFTYKSGKWSMADVFVVALFMAFIGFNGIIGDQLSHLSNTNKYVEILTTNGTNLQVGFYMFLMFCLAGLFLSETIQKSEPDPN
jgi:hypothetical protein